MSIMVLTVAAELLFELLRMPSAIYSLGGRELIP